MNLPSFFRVLASTLLVLCMTGTGVLAQQNPRALFERARMLDESNRDLQEAIDLYARVADAADGQRPLAAEAQLRVGRLYERLGQTGQARQAYQVVLDQYTDQAEVARKAQAKIAAAQGAEEQSGVVTRHLWTGPQGAHGAASPDGRYLSYVDWTTGNLALRDLASEENRHLTHKGDWSDSNEYAEVSVWSPDAEQVVYTWFNGGFYELRIVGREGAEPRVLYSNEQTEYLWPAAWSQDGTRVLALITKPDKTNRIVLISVSDGSTRVLKSLGWRSPETMSLSPEGRYVVYDAPTTREAPERDIFLLATDGSKETTLVEHAASDHDPTWTPDGERILFVSDRRGTSDLWALEVAETQPKGPPRLIKQNVGSIRPLGFAESGAYFYTRTKRMSDVYTAAFDPETGTLRSAPEPVTERFMGTNEMPAWSPDGTRLAFLSRRRHQGERSTVLVVHDVKTGDERDLTLSFDATAGPTWLRDGQSLMLPGLNAKGRRGLYRVTAQTGKAALVTPLESNKVWPAGGERLVYLHSRGDRSSEDATAQPPVSVFAYDLDTRRKRMLYRSHHVHAAALSPDGQQFAFSSADELPAEGVPNSNVLKVLPVAGGEPRDLVRVPMEDEITNVTWMADGTDLIYAHEQGGGTVEVQRVSAQGGEPVPYDLSPDTLNGGFDTLQIHPGGTRIAYSSGGNPTEFWVMENILSELQAAQ